MGKNPTVMVHRKRYRVKRHRSSIASSIVVSLINEIKYAHSRCSVEELRDAILEVHENDNLWEGLTLLEKAGKELSK